MQLIFTETRRQERMLSGVVDRYRDMRHATSVYRLKTHFCPDKTYPAFDSNPTISKS